MKPVYYQAIICFSLWLLGMLIVFALGGCGHKHYNFWLGYNESLSVITPTSTIEIRVPKKNDIPK